MEIKNTLQGINNRLDDTDEWLSEVEDKGAEITPAEKKKEFLRMRIVFLNYWPLGQYQAY